MFELYIPALIVAFLITILEMTEVVALVFALAADHTTVRHGALGAVGGTAVVAAIAFGFGAVLIAFPRSYLLWGSAVVLAAFGVFLFRSTLKTYRRQRAAASGAAPSSAKRNVAQFAGGFSVGAVESTETVVVLLALAAAGYGFSAIVGAVLGGALLVAVTLVVHDRIRRIKVPWLKVGGTSVVFSFAVFWGGEAAGVSWPGGDLILLLFVAVAVLFVRGGVGVVMRGSPPPAAPA
jgi:Ca2+/H+ antiporter, TMEM165/GDT1 family